ncbi:MAG TPA: endolytic transglycosylase MltG, partial [Stellaceae bacterium]|nr:endolytic transglycosylase MltG [Stellaceae bacterium]
MKCALRAAGGLIAILLLAGIALFIGARSYDAPGPLTAAKIVVIPKGAGAREIGTLLAANGIVENGYLFAVGTYASGRAGDLKAGEYEFAAAISPAGAADLIDSGKVYRHKLTIPEGLTSAQIVALIDAAPKLDGTIDAEPPEGTLLPDTYFYVMGNTRQELLTRMHRAMEKALTETWAARAPGLPLASPMEAVTLASIIEKETAKPDERPRVAGVYIERLKQGMKLQADPTVIYVMTRGGAVPMPHPLGHDDLAIESPYNTYADKGLPPTPIDNPGIASLKAALQPDDRGDLYFVADGS